jgi:ribose transport system permease protein
MKVATNARWLRRLLSESSYVSGPLLIAVVLFAANIIWQSSFINPSNWASTLALASPFVLTALAQTPPVLSGQGGLDLSVGPFAGLVAVLIAQKFVPAGLGAPELLIPLVILTGLAGGAINGVLVAYVRLPPIIATLGTYLFYTGIAAEILPTPGGSVPHWLGQLAQSYGPIPGTLIVFAVIAAGWLLLSRTAYVRHLLTVGGDDRAALTSGVNVSIVRVLAYALAGLFAAIAGLMLAGSLQSADATLGPPLTISSVAAIALGGISLAGGRGGLLGAAIGGASYYMIQNLLTVVHVSPFQLDIADGGTLIAALALSALIERRRRRRGVRTVELATPVQTSAAQGA